MLRKLAGDLRDAAARRDAERRAKVAGLLAAAAGIAMLRSKLEVHRA